MVADATAEQDGEPPGRSVGPVAETKRRAIVATADLIDRLDYRSVTIEAVSRASGVSKSTIYRHWPSRHALVLEAVTYKTDALTAVADTGDAIVDVRTYLDRLAFGLNFGGVASTISGLIADAIYDEELADSLRATSRAGDASSSSSCCGDSSEDRSGPTSTSRRWWTRCTEPSTTGCS